jgi:hypothetical protein
MSTARTRGTVTVKVSDADGVVLHVQEEIAPAEEGHDEGRCTMWCQRCYVEACGAPELPTRGAAR